MDCTVSVRDPGQLCEIIDECLHTAHRDASAALQGLARRLTEIRIAAPPAVQNVTACLLHGALQ